MSSPRTKEAGASRARRIVAGSVAAFVLACLPGAALSGLASAEDQLKENKQELRETRDKVRVRSKRIRALQKHMNGLATRISRSQSDILAAEQRIEKLARRMTIQRIARFVEDDVFRKLHRQILVRHRHDSAGVAMDDRDRTTPIALA